MTSEKKSSVGSVAELVKLGKFALLWKNFCENKESLRNEIPKYKKAIILNASLSFICVRGMENDMRGLRSLVDYFGWEEEASEYDPW